MRHSYIHIVFFICLFVLAACQKTPVEDKSFDPDLAGEYELTDVFWPGPQIDVDGDNKAGWHLLTEFRNLLNYYEPDYVATVYLKADAEQPSERGGEWFFSFALPFPDFTFDEEQNKYYCPWVGCMKYTIRKKQIIPSEHCIGNIHPNIEKADNWFLSGVQDIALFVDDWDGNMLKVRVRCSLPCAIPFQQEVHTNTLVYEFKKKAHYDNS